MPAMNKNGVNVWIKEKILVMKAKKVATEQHEGQAHSNGELSQEHEDWPVNNYGRYKHKIYLPKNIEFEKIKAQ
ncbi:hypothetical protein RYX36_020231, partial [Vicia faba]